MTALAVASMVAAAGCGTTPTAVTGTGVAAQPAAVRDGGFEFVVRDVVQVHQVGDPSNAAGSILRSLREGIDPSTAAGRIIAGVLASLAELELDLGRERRTAARAARRARGQDAG